MGLIEKARAAVTSTVKLAAAAVAVVIAGAFLALAPDWTLDRLETGISGAWDGLTAFGGWAAHIVRSHTS